MDYVCNQVTEQNCPVGRVVVLPSTFIASPRNMQEKYIYTQHFGKSDLSYYSYMQHKIVKNHMKSCWMRKDTI